ncbi:M14 family zinc carboxypeptidase [Abyssibacter profundi]|uniref:Peptidase M14 domain-containing protein n=1 Tax=Abyssibacter profundi TaxID=2182787 RepID=A0A363UNR1_9GAMM|nr:M14 family zinc carboxypeptidase [Abyssibacter profundi]PWN57090.1 hypothetical protein DEH80_03925 [Abyssibacter profundi]
MARGLVFVAIACWALLVHTSATATVQTYVESGAGTNEIELGYPVPTPVDSALPVAGFRSYASLLARHRDLAGLGVIEERRVGTTLEGRPIWAYVIGDADLRLADGSGREPAIVFNGGTHAREWASPEVATALLETLAAGAQDGAFIEFLIDQTTIVLLPVLNIDGFLHTQRTPAQVLRTRYSGDPSNWPRDGRMRRKNMRGVDNDLTTEADGMLGVDLNRNNSPFWATSSRSSRDTASLVYHGAGPASEPEVLALQAAVADWEDRLRLFVDIHSFSRVFFAADTGHARRDAIARQVANIMGAATSGYGYDPSPAGGGIGALDEYFAYRYQIPSYTLEIEPGAAGASEYGHNGVTHDGFILPEDQVTRVRDELASALLLGAYRQAGPPVVHAFRLEAADGMMLAEGAWQPDGQQARQLDDQPATQLPTGELTLALQFDRPMRQHDGQQVLQYRGQSVPLLPAVTLVGRDADDQPFEWSVAAADMRWSGVSDSARYRADTLFITLDVEPGSGLAAARRLDVVVDAQDLSGQRLDALPATVADWADGGWTRYEDADGRSGDVGGASAAFRLVGAGGPDAPVPSSSSGGGGSGAVSPLLGLGGWLLVAWRQRRRRGSARSAACSRVSSARPA